MYQQPHAHEIVLVPEIGVPFDIECDYLDLKIRAEAACNTALMLEPYGLDLTPEDADNTTAAVLTSSYAADPEGTSVKASERRLAKLRPAALVQVSNMLGQFGQMVVHDSIQIRHLVTNKLLVEVEHDDARIRLRALEMLGKISDVGLFTDKKEITVAHTTTDDLRARLKSKLQRLIGEDTPEEVEYEVVQETTDAG